MRITTETVERTAGILIKRKIAVTKRSHARRFNSNFGCTPSVCTSLWNRLDETNDLPRTARISHLLWSLMFLKVYATETVFASIFECDEKTLRKWIWMMIEKIATINVVSWFATLSHRFFYLKRSNRSSDNFWESLFAGQRQRMQNFCGWDGFSHLRAYAFQS